MMKLGAKAPKVLSQNPSLLHGSCGRVLTVIMECPSTRIALPKPSNCGSDSGLHDGLPVHDAVSEATS